MFKINHLPFQSEHTPAGPVLFITDTSLLKTTKPYFQCQFRSDYYNCQTLFQEKGGQVLELKDVLLEQGVITINHYGRVDGSKNSFLKE